MASADWTELSDALATASLRRNVTPGITPPNGGGSFVYGFNSLDVSEGAAGLFCNGASFAPMASGGQITGCLQRGAGGGPQGFAPMLFLGLQGVSVNDEGYLLGLSDGDPGRIMLKKGVLSAGLEDLEPDPTNNGVLRRSTRTVAIGEWVHLRLDMIVNATGDVVLKVYENDLAANPLSGAASWAAVAGMDDFIDDNLQVATGSAPFTSGRGGFGFQTADVTRRGYVDHLTLERQL